ncbi:hypothetical protein GII36_00695 [Candidatus Mycosynbacter amalyticus]|uniref:Uncharacterized protein n=1 Tax=Candidatus Mycosynbacter amalyticus TaxID=2665156 RepID=A0A857MSE7_9BACT|nr:hypothetical protein [Candidatus Mycosynbacter amalyticus]QHN42377.1 hypothetical protein GII36_00695 [Candidatus Mycosynbacter amalyticus]
MSELSEVAVVTLEVVVPSEAMPSRKIEEYAHYFGKLSLQASINSIEAYCETTPDKDVSRAWLLRDRAQLELLLGQSRHPQAHLHGALMRVSTEMWASMFMQKFVQDRPRRLQGVTQSEITTA